jgi:hypothetical protein
VIPIGSILFLTRSSGSIQNNSDEISQYDTRYDPTLDITPDKNWLPPYPYCTSDVLFMAE